MSCSKFRWRGVSAYPYRLLVCFATKLPNVLHPRVHHTSLATQVLDGVTPQVQFVKIVNDELVELMGSAGSKDLNPGQPQVILMAGLQGVGKTTACGKLASFLTKRRNSVLLVATDVYRPAAIDQLVKLGSKIGVPVFEMGTDVSPVEIARAGIAKAKAEGIDTVIVDTAGRLQVCACVCVCVCVCVCA